MAKTTNARHRAHMTYRHRTPWSGTTEEFTGGSDSFIMLLLAVAPAAHAPDERLEVVVNDKLATAHPLDWMVRMYELNASMLISPVGGVDTRLRPEAREASDVSVVDAARVLGEVSDQLRYIVRRLTIAVEDKHDMTDEDTRLAVGQLAGALKEFSAAALHYQSVPGVRLARAVLLPPRGKVELRTSRQSVVSVTSGGLAAHSTEGFF